MKCCSTFLEIKGLHYPKFEKDVGSTLGPWRTSEKRINYVYRVYTRKDSCIKIFFFHILFVISCSFFTLKIYVKAHKKYHLHPIVMTSLSNMLFSYNHLKLSTIIQYFSSYFVCNFVFIFTLEIYVKAYKKYHLHPVISINHAIVLQPSKIVNDHTFFFVFC